MLILIILLLASLAYYLSFLFTVRRGLRHLRPSHAGGQNSFVSVIVPARNESKEIVRCLESLCQQDYPAASLEIIVVDDHSTDQTLQIARDFATRLTDKQVSVLSLAESAGKPNAIAQGVRNAKGELILCTDADCVVGRGWIGSMARQFDDGIGFVAGPVLESPSGSFLSKLQSLEFLGLITAGAGLIGAGKPIICSGANIAYTKEAFEAVDGYGKESGSCDDETLMQRIAARKIGRIVFNGDQEAVVVTSTPPTFREFWRQRTRWAAKRGRYENKAILLRLILLYSPFLLLPLAVVTAAFEPRLWVPIIVTLVVKACADYVTLREGAGALRQSVPPWHFLIAELLHVPYIACAGLIGQITSIRWKERTLHR
jgi:cellulose synthase/poly-beta-1,6-N-acetylglucosamine synthase-like glycosyltransferase